MLTKQKQYYFDAFAARVPTTEEGMRNKRTVWSVNTKSYPGLHFAPWPEALVEDCILTSTSARGCCPDCGAPWHRLVCKTRVATRPGTSGKVAALVATTGP